MVYVGENVYKCTLYLCNVSKFKKCRKKGCNFYCLIAFCDIVADFLILCYTVYQMILQSGCFPITAGIPDDRI